MIFIYIIRYIYIYIYIFLIYTVMIYIYVYVYLLDMLFLIDLLVLHFSSGPILVDSKVKDLLWKGCLSVEIGSGAGLELRWVKLGYAVDQVSWFCVEFHTFAHCSPFWFGFVSAVKMAYTPHRDFEWDNDEQFDRWNIMEYIKYIKYGWPISKNNKKWSRQKRCEKSETAYWDFLSGCF